MLNVIPPSVRELIDTAAEKYGDKPFISFVRDGETQRRSYRKVQQDSLAICRYIRHLSEKKLHIAIIGKTDYEYLTSLTGILISGNVAVPLSPETSAVEAADLFSRADIDMLIYDAQFAGKIDEIKLIYPNLRFTLDLSDSEKFQEIFNDYTDASEYAHLSDIKVDNDECAIIIFTSGTTGVRKGVMLSTANIVSNIMYEELTFSDEDISLSVLPMYHIFCFSGDYLKNLKEGIGLCLSGSIRDIGSSLARFEPAVMRIVPMIAQSLLQKVRIVQAKNPELDIKEAARVVFGRNMKWIYSGGAYLSPALAEEYDKLGIYLRQGYGMTEAGGRISVPDERTDKASVGRVMSICDIRVRGGEIQFRSPSAMLGYYKMPQETAEALTEDGWYRTGDIGYVTDDRQLFITGRVKNLIILSNGENVSPEELERKIERDPLVEEVVVYAENDVIVAEIYPDLNYAQLNGITEIEEKLNNLISELNSNATSSHVIGMLKVRNTPIEKTTSGKILRHAAD